VRAVDFFVTLARMSLLDEYQYEIPEELIAHVPAEPRDSARLFVYDTATDTVLLKTFRDLPDFIPQALLVYNDTTVLPARVQCFYKEQPIELLVLVDQGIGNDGVVRALVNRRVRAGERIVASQGEFLVLEDHEKSMLLRFESGVSGLHKLLMSAGETPLPPYIHSPVSEAVKRTQYQSRFASGQPSVAAPTASLHFTDRVYQKLVGVGVDMVPITLQVGLGTFAPIFAENFTTKQLHTEYYTIPKTTVGAIKKAEAKGRKIVAVGTTVVRTLESSVKQILDQEFVTGKTDIFIYPPHHFTYPHALITNFHVPRSSLLCLVDAFLQHKKSKCRIIDLYNIAIKNRFRLYSFGDAMLIL
jgi:S-adenosylmethionine:tRNA ribosyltransferase-isomerase